MPRTTYLRLALSCALIAAGLLTAAPGAGARAARGAVYTLSNQESENKVIVLKRSTNGDLSPFVEVSTGGLGSGAGLGSQGALVLDDRRNHLFAVSAGSDELSLLRAQGTRVSLLDTVPSGGDLPVSVTYHGSLVYVLNDGAENNISGFRISDDSLVPIRDSRRRLSADAADAAQIEFTPDGNFLVVTEKATNAISVYRVGTNGKVSRSIVNPSEGDTPFGFAFDPRGRLLVSEAFGGAPDASAVSSYRISSKGTLRTLEASAPTTETAACWVVVAPNHFAYTTNTGSGTLSAFLIHRDGALTLRDEDGVTAGTGPETAPIDMDLTVGGRYLYVLNSATIDGFRVRPDGGLERVAGLGALPSSTVGLVVR